MNKDYCKEFIGTGERGVRAMRDIVYGHPISENEWQNCKHNWMRPDSTIWLMGQVNAIRAKEASK